MALSPRDLALLQEATAEELVKRGQELLRLGRELMGISAQILGEEAPETEGLERPKPEAKKPEELQGAFRTSGRFGIVDKSRAFKAMQELMDFTRQDFADKVGLSPIAANRWLAMYLRDGTLTYDSGGWYHCQKPPPLRDWVVEQGEDVEIEVERCAKSLRLSPEIVRAELDNLAQRGIIEWLREDVFRYAPILDPGPRSRPRRTPPEKLPPAGVESRATGMPVRIRKDTRKQRSTPGQRHKIQLKEQRYQQVQQAKAERAAAQKTKAQKDPKWKRKK